MPRRRWEGIIKTDLKEIVWDGVDWINLAQDMDRQVVGSCEHGNKPSGPIKGREFLEYLIDC
jgi:hypothetical protein